MEQLTLSTRYHHIIEETKEHFYALQTNIQLSGNQLKVIAITSTYKNEGKTTTAVGLAASLARTGSKVLLLDTDIRNSVLSGIFHATTPQPGLTEYLSGNTEMLEGFSYTDIDQLYVFGAGALSPNPVALLRSQKFSKLIEVLKNRFDYIIVDTPPIGQVIDAALIVQACDASLLVTEFNKVTRNSLKQSRTQLEQTGVPFLGIVVNKNTVANDQYGYYGYGYYSNNE